MVRIDIYIQLVLHCYYKTCQHICYQSIQHTHTHTHAHTFQQFCAVATERERIKKDHKRNCIFKIVPIKHEPKKVSNTKDLRSFKCYLPKIKSSGRGDRIRSDDIRQVLETGIVGHRMIAYIGMNIFKEVCIALYGYETSGATYTTGWKKARVTSRETHKDKYY